MPGNNGIMVSCQCSEMRARAAAQPWSLAEQPGYSPLVPQVSFQVSPPSDCWEWDDEALGLVFYSFISVESTNRLDEVDLMLAQI